MLTKHLAMFARDRARARARQSKAQTQAEQATCTCLSKRITKLMNVLHDLFQGGLNRKSNELKLATQVNTGRQAGRAGQQGRGRGPYRQQGAKSLETAKSYKVKKMKTSQHPHALSALSVLLLPAQLQNLIV